MNNTFDSVLCSQPVGDICISLTALYMFDNLLVMILTLISC